MLSVRLAAVACSVALVLSVTSAAEAQAPASAAPAAAGSISVTARLEAPKNAAGDPLPVKLGDRVVFMFVVDAPADAKVFPPSPPAFGAAFKRLSPRAVITRKPGANRRVVEEHRWQLLTVRVGPERIPRFEVGYKQPDGSTGTIDTKVVRVRVRRRLLNEQDPKLGGAPPPVSVVTTNWALIWGLTLAGSALLAVLLTLVGLYVYRNRIVALRPQAPPVPANVAALSKLKEILNSALPPEERYAAIVDVLREYLGGRYLFDGLETTTGEMQRALKDEELGEISVYEVQQLLEEADLVKFARMTPSDEDARSKADSVKRVVELTWKEPDPEDAVEEVIRLEAASVRERVIAGAVDLGIAGLAGALTATTVWRIWGAEWAWIGLVVYGGLVLVRDLASWTSAGKLSQALIVVRRDELQMAPSVGQLIGRNLLLALPLGAPVEALMLLYHPLGVRIGGVWSGTEVVRRPSSNLRSADVGLARGSDSRGLAAAGGTR